ncbi:cupin domain-containing protein [bacterium]|nr:cupin domain-containing protein [bacterium]
MSSRARCFARAAAAALAFLSLAACSSSGERTDGKDGGRPAPGEKRQALAEKPFFSCFDAIEKSYLQGGSFPPGQTSVAATIHRAPHATLFFMATRGEIARHVLPRHEETVFIYSGTGKLLLEDGRKPIAIEAGHVVRIPEGVCHGLSGNPADPLKAIVVTSPAWTIEDDKQGSGAYLERTTDMPNTIGAPTIFDVLDPSKTIERLPPLTDKAVAQTFIKKRVLDDTARSTLQVVAVRHGKIQDHRHEHHDETVIIFAQQGRGLMRMGGELPNVEDGSVIHIPEGCVHSFEHQGEGHSRAISIYTEGGGKDDIHEVKPDDKDPHPNHYYGGGKPLNVGPGQPPPSEPEIRPIYSPEKSR